MNLPILNDLPIATTAPATVSRGYVRVEAGVSLELPFSVVRGAKPGPRLLITGGVHGSEYASIEAAVRVSHTDAQRLAGTLVVLPIINLAAYRARSIYINPVDGKNLNRFFPGDPNGSHAEQLAHWLTEHAIKGSDAYLDLHGGDMIEDLIPFTIFVEGHQPSRELAEVFGLPLLVSTGPKGTTIAAAFQNGIPSVLAEAGGNGLWPEKDVAVLERGVKRVMQHLGMLEGTPQALPTQQLTQFAWLRAEQDGLWYPAVGAGVEVKVGQHIGRITDPFGQVLQSVISPIAGVTLFAVTSMAIGNNDPLYGIGA